MSDPLTPDRLAEMKGRPWPGTPGPWFCVENRHPTTDGRPWGVVEKQRHPAGGAGVPLLHRIRWEGTKQREVAAFIAAAPDIRADLAELVGVVEAQQQEIARLREAMRDAADQLDLFEEPPPLLAGAINMLRRALSPRAPEEGDRGEVVAVIDADEFEEARRDPQVRAVNEAADEYVKRLEREAPDA